MRINIEKETCYKIYVFTDEISICAKGNTYFQAITNAVKECRKRGDYDSAKELLARFKKDFQCQHKRNKLTNKLTIIDITDMEIIFDNGSYIQWSHFQDCCEDTYADLSQIKDCVGMKFDTPIMFEQSENYGFRFGNGINMVFVPCYSEQNGYYSAYVDVEYFDANSEIIYNHSFKGELIYRD